MSLDEKKCQKQLPDIYLTESICRSKSFGGLSHRRTSSADATFASAKAFDTSLTKSVYSGANLSPSSSPNTSKLSWGNWIQALKITKSSKQPKSPLPVRMQIIFDSICKGLKDSIMLVQNEISNSRVAFDNISVSSVKSQGRLYEFEKQMKTNERYLKKLEFHLSKLEELKEQYDVQHRIRDGIRAMGYAYILSPGKLNDMALQSVKSEFKESTEVMCTYENTMESLMGTLIFEMIGIQGFARICSGDVFEVVVKHGDQKWKSRGRVLKSYEQIWENKSIAFNSLFNELLCIKAVEVRGLGKNVLLGNKVCEIRDLFCAHSQQMTINLNRSGSLKLNLIITWHPLNTAKDGILLPQMSYSIGRNCQSLSVMQECESLSEFSSTSKKSTLQSPAFCDSSGPKYIGNSNVLSAQISSGENLDEDSTNERHSTDCDCIHCNSPCLNETRANLMPTNSNLNDSQTWSFPLNEENSDTNSISSSGQNLSEICKCLILMLEDIPIHYKEIAEFTPVLGELHTVLKGKECSTSDSNVSISVESALGCFDFLNTAIENEDPDSSNDRMSEHDDKNTLDQSNDTLHLEKQMLNLDINSLSLSSKNEELDTVIMDHLTYCTKLISILISVGPFKSLEESLRKKITEQKKIFLTILSAFQKKCIAAKDFFEEKESAIQQIWMTAFGNVLYCRAEQFRYEMENILRAKTVLDNYMASIVSPRLVCDILDCNDFDPSSRVSLFFFKSFFSGHKTPHCVLLEYVADSLATEDLKCQDIQKAFYAVSVLSKLIPSQHSLFQIGFLLIDSRVEFRNIAASYLGAVSTNDDLKQKVISTYLKMLKMGNTVTKIVCCKALEILESGYCIEKLMYIMDKESDVEIQEAISSFLQNVHLE